MPKLCAILLHEKCWNLCEALKLGKSINRYVIRDPCNFHAKTTGEGFCIKIGGVELLPAIVVIT